MKKSALQTARASYQPKLPEAIKNGVTIVDDYAHHPAEIAATLKTAKEMSFKRVWAVHQPFTYSRTAMLLDEFAKALPSLDRVVLTEIMGSREISRYIHTILHVHVRCRQSSYLPSVPHFCSNLHSTPPVLRCPPHTFPSRMH